MIGTMVSFSTVNSGVEFSWVATKSVKDVLNKIKQQNQESNIVIHNIQHMNYDNFINYIENNK